MKSFEINSNDAGQRMDKFLAKAVPLMPKSLMYKYLRTKRIKLNGKKSDISTKLSQGDIVEMYINDEFFVELPKTMEFMLASSTVDIIYEDENLLLLNKPAGLVVHEDESGTADTLINRALKYLYEKGEYKPTQENSFIPSLCNRIDRNTSGIVICAKNAPTLRVMNEKIKNRELAKKYLCIVHGEPKPSSAKVELFMTKDSNEKKIVVTDRPVPNGRNMITLYKTLKTTGEYSLLEVELITGRTHQIRATMQYIGHPIVGEGKYGLAANSLGMKFQALCSYSLTLRFVGESTHLSYLNGREFHVGENPFIKFFK